LDIQGAGVIKRDFPKIHFYDQDFVDIYDKTWAWIQDCWNTGNEKSTGEKPSGEKSESEKSESEKSLIEQASIETCSPEPPRTEAILIENLLSVSEMVSFENPPGELGWVDMGNSTEQETSVENPPPDIASIDAEQPVDLEHGADPTDAFDLEHPFENEHSFENEHPFDLEHPSENETEAALTENSSPEKASTEKPRISGKFFSYPGSGVVQQVDAIFSSFFLVYSNRIYQAHPTLDIFYEHQEPDGAIRSTYDIATGLPVVEADNPEGLGLPLFAWAEFNLYHKSANKKRVKEVLPILHKYTEWIDSLFKRPNGLYAVPLSATGMVNAPRENAAYPLDFNAMMAINVLYLSALADILNDKEASFQYKRQYFSLKTRINTLMWDNDAGFYYDIDKDEQHILVKTIAGYWPLLAEIPNDDKAERLIDKLQSPQLFGTPHPFPTVAANELAFDENGSGYRGAVFPHLTFMVIKGLERYQRWDFARECAIRHLYFVLDSMSPEGNTHNSHHTGNHHKGNLWEAYLPLREGPAQWTENPAFPRSQYLTYDALSTVCLTIENIVGLFISLPRKTVDWIIPSLEIMGVENLSLKKNMITILSNKSGRGWEIHMESEKLYYFTINILGKKKKTLPIPSGKCSMLIDKL
jgi:neutral trehalase